MRIKCILVITINYQLSTKKISETFRFGDFFISTKRFREYRGYRPFSQALQ